MQLLLQREQGKNIIGRPIFKLWAKFDLPGEEMELIAKYRVQNFLLYEGNVRRDMNRALRWSIPIGFLATSFLLLRGGIGPGFFGGILIFVALTYLIYEQIRERIYVVDVLQGRHFTCRSVVTLAAKEQLMNNLSVIFCRFLEAMKTWGGQEIIELDPHNLPTIRIIEAPLQLYAA